MSFRMSNAAAQESFDAVIVGAGFGGIYALKLLRDLGLRCLVIDQAGDVGGTWWWNLYPGAMSDTESYVYRFSWDEEDLQSYPWPERYVKQPEVLAYLNHIVDKHRMRGNMRFNTEIQGATWDSSEQQWSVSVNTSTSTIAARYLVTCLGLLSKQNLPEIAGIRSFQGDMYHTAKWPKDYSVDGKRVGIIGSGSTGVQVITQIASNVQSLICFQRHPQYSVPSGDRQVTPEYRDWVNENYRTIWDRVRNSVTAFGFEESQTSYHDVSPDEREGIFQDAWDQGNGFRFMFGTFNDIATDPEANEGACIFIRKKIDEIVKDPKKASKLKPTDIYARRPLCDGNASNNQKYFEQFNREHVEIVDLKETPIVQIEAGGVRTGDGRLYELDCLILATGFDAVEGNYSRMTIAGREGVSLADAWSEGPTSCLGIFVPSKSRGWTYKGCSSSYVESYRCLRHGQVYPNNSEDMPNFFMVNGPKGPFTNNPPAIEAEVEFIAETIQRAERAGTRLVEVTHEGEQRWSKLCEELAADSLFWKAQDNWIFGANIPGKKRCLRFFFGGMKKYREEQRKCIADGYPGFKPFFEPFSN